MRRALVLAFLLVGAGALPSTGVAQISPTEVQQEERQKAYWQDRYRRLTERIRDAQERLEAASAELSRARHHRTLRGGEQKLPVLGDIARAEADLMESARALEALPEEARRAGAPPGWLRELEGESPLVGMDRVLAESADTPDRHTELAQRFRTRAMRLRAEAESHESMSFAYGSTRMRSAGDQRKHCARLATLSRELADEYDRLADGNPSEAEP
jgi:hypothetical protein